jgi:methionyl-tRNA synthetase
MLNKLYITTPIYYVNASPHIGHSYTCIAADCLARSLRQQLGKENVWFLTGTDEHGQKIQKAAGENNLSPQEFVDKVVVQFTGLWEKLNISYDDFIRTTEKRHIKVVEQVLEILYKKGDIYPDKYQGWYCTPCETFWVESQLKNQFCPDCLRPVERIAEENFFFRLSAYQEWLIDYLNQHQDFIKPQNRLVEVFKFLKLNKLDDLCISRPKERLGWGIPLPFSPAHVTYVWFDALVNYISAVGEFNSSNTYNSKWWDDQTQVVHLVGKDILRQHAVYWPIMLKALGMRMPDTIFAHGWWMMGEDKMSKSRGNVVSPLRMLDKYGVDAYRYFLLRDVPFGLDGNFSEEAIIKRFNGDLANDLGNLVFRTLTMLEKYYQGNVPQLDISKIKFDERGEKIKRTLGLMELALKSDFNFSAALEKIWLGVNLVNKYIEEKKPWNLSKDNKHTELQGFIRLLVEAIRKISEDIYPFLPQTAQAIKEQLGQDKIKKGNPLFPRILLT